jgi:hypothetical protein
MNVNLDNTYWDRLRGFVTELRVDARWVLREEKTEKPYGSLRIVAHPDLPPGQLRAVFNYVTTIEDKSDVQKLQATEDYQMELTELEVYSVDEEIETKNETIEAPYKELEEIFGVKVFDKKK